MGNRHYIDTALLIPPFQEPDLSYIKKAQEIISLYTDGMDCYIELQYDNSETKFYHIKEKSVNISDSLALSIMREIEEAISLLQQK